MKTQFLLTDIPLVLRDALELRARTEGTSVTNVIGSSLASRYGLRFDPSPRREPHERFEAGEYVRKNGQSIGLAMNFRLPLAVVEKLREEAGATGRRQREIVLVQLAATLRVDWTPPPKPRNRGHGRPRGRKVIA